MQKTLIGRIYYASKDAQRKRYYFEGRQIGTNNYHSVYYLSDTFAEINFDSSGTNYIHLQIG